MATFGASRIAALVLGTLGVVVLSGSAAGAVECGAAPAAAGDRPLRANLSPVEASHTITLGRSVEKTRRWEVEFTWTEECDLPATGLPATIRILQGTDASLDLPATTVTAAADNSSRRLFATLNIARSDVPPGAFEGVVEVGNGVVGIGKAALTLKHQEPLTSHNMNAIEQGVWIVCWALLASGLLLFARQRRQRQADGTKRLALQDFTTPLALLAGAMALYPIIGNLRQDRVVPALWWPIWLGVAALIGGFLFGVLRHRTNGGTLQGGLPFAGAIVLSFGTGVATWQAQYLNTPDWALRMESALQLVATVGGATAAAALVFLTQERPSGG